MNTKKKEEFWNIYEKEKSGVASMSIVRDACSPGPAGGHRTGRRLRIAKGLESHSTWMRLAANIGRNKQPRTASSWGGNTRRRDYPPKPNSLTPGRTKVLIEPCRESARLWARITK